MEHTINVVLKAEQLGTFLGLPITNSLVMTWVVMALLVLFAFLVRRKLAMVPGKLQTAVEWVIEGAYGYVAETFESEAMAKRFFPLLATIFLFIVVGNELEFFPGVGSIGFTRGADFIPLLRTPAADLNFTLALAIICFLVIEVTGALTLGVLKHAGRYINFSKPFPLNFVVGLIELMSNLGRLISFSFRLFGNIFAGEVMILVASFFLPYLLPVPLMAFEMFIGVVQALVFSMLTLFFIKLAIVDPHEAH